VISLLDGAWASKSIGSWERLYRLNAGIGFLHTAGDGGVCEVVDVASLICCVGKTTRKHSGAKQWTKMASWESGSAEMECRAASMEQSIERSSKR
jgi:hypothetical protein